MRFSNEFYFVTTAGMLALDEVPADCGLIEVGTALTDDSKRLVRRHEGTFYLEAATGWSCLVMVPAPWRDTPGPTWQLAAAMLRNQQRTMGERPPTWPNSKN